MFVFVSLTAHLEKKHTRMTQSLAQNKKSPLDSMHYSLFFMLYLCCVNIHTDIFLTNEIKFDIRTLHDCPSQMNENVLISNSKLTSDSELIWWR